MTQPPTNDQMVQSDKLVSVLAGCRAIGGLAETDAKCRTKLREAGVCAALDGLVQDNNEEIRHVACKTIRAMAKDVESMALFVKIGTLRLLVCIVRTQVTSLAFVCGVSVVGTTVVMCVEQTSRIRVLLVKSLPHRCMV